MSGHFGELIQPTPMRAAIARRMVDSKREAPHFYVSTEISMGACNSALVELRRHTATKVSVTVMIASAVVASLRSHPRLNAVWTDEGLVEVKAIHLGVAVALDDGLIAPAILDADQIDVYGTATALSSLVERARSRRLRPAEMTDATFTLSNLGMFGVSAFAAIIVPPQVAILATGRPRQRLAMVDGRAVAEDILTVTLSADHRALDGADVARFLETLTANLERMSYESMTMAEPGE